MTDYFVVIHGTRGAETGWLFMSIVCVFFENLSAADDLARVCLHLYRVYDEIFGDVPCLRQRITKR